MNEPNSVNHWNGYDPKAYEKWAKENKKRADRLLAAARAILEPMSGPSDKLREETQKRTLELQNAATDYEDTRG